MIAITTEVQGLRDVIGRFTRTDINAIARRELEPLRDKGKRLLQSEAPVKTGALKKQIHGRLYRNPIRIDLYSPATYTKYVLKGTRPHIIQPKRAGGMLRFEVGGRIVFARQVSHPGTKPNRFDARAFGRLLPEISAAKRRLKARAVSELGGS